MNTRKKFVNINTFVKLCELLYTVRYGYEQIKTLQLKKARKLLLHAYNNFPFYRERMEKARFDPWKLSDIWQIKNLPVLEKEEYRDFTESLRKNYPERFLSCHIDKTSGSTGMPIKIVRTWDEVAYTKAKLLRVLFVNGFRPLHKIYSIVPSQRLVPRDSILQKIGLMPRYMKSFSEPVEKIIEEYFAAEPHVLYALKPQLVQMAMHIIKNHIRIKKPRLCVSFGETLDKASKKIIQDVFGKENLIDMYGAMEFGVLAFQTKKAGFLNFCHDTNLLEIDNKGFRGEGKGTCIITDLHTYSIPLIRYRLGDWIETEFRHGLRVIKAIRGRLDDWITWKDGSRSPFQIFYGIMGKRDEILQFRIIQETYDIISILLVLKKETRKKAVEKAIIMDLKENVRNDVIFRIEFVESIPPDANGKLARVVSKVSGARDKRVNNEIDYSNTLLQ